jgi:hypothetical protein
MSKQDEEIIFLLDQCHLELGNAKIGPESAKVLGKYAERIERHYAGHNMRLDNPEDKQGSGTSPNRGSSLHTKLQTIRIKQEPCRHCGAVDFIPLSDEAVAQILQAFQEAGYYKPQVNSEMQHLIDDGSISPLETGPNG